LDLRLHVEQHMSNLKQPDGSSMGQRTKTTNTAAPATPPK
jgi:hypothetical protein